MRPLLLLAALFSLPVGAQPTLSPVPAERPVALVDDEAGVRAAVARLFDGMRARDSSAVASVLHSDLRLMTALERDGVGHLEESSRAGFLSAIAAAPVVLDEQIADLEVRTDGPLASAWMTYRFYAGERLSHCGVNAMQLARVDGRWQILHVIDTRRHECGDTE